MFSVCVFFSQIKNFLAFDFSSLFSLQSNTSLPVHNMPQGIYDEVLDCQISCEPFIEYPKWDNISKRLFLSFLFLQKAGVTFNDDFWNFVRFLGSIYEFFIFRFVCVAAMTWGKQVISVKVFLRTCFKLPARFKSQTSKSSSQTLDRNTFNLVQGSIKDWQLQFFFLFEIF